MVFATIKMISGSSEVDFAKAKVIPPVLSNFRISYQRAGNLLPFFR
jgi:hypothetical protein